MTLEETPVQLGAEPALPSRRLVIAERLESVGPRLDALGLDANRLDIAWIGGHAPSGATALAADRAPDALGREFDAVVVDVRTGLHVDALGAAAGTIRAGGVLVLVTPALEDWPAFDDPAYERIAAAGWPHAAVCGRFLRRLVRIIRKHPHTAVSESGICPPLQPGKALIRADEDGCRTDDQRRAVAELVHMGLGRARRPVVLTADRGRGKSSALGLAAARLLKAGVERVVITAPRQSATAQVFEHAARHLPQARSGPYHVKSDNGGEILFRAPDELALGEAPDPARAVFVDEAAAIPAPLLERLLERQPRIAFATTVHGYEGTGRGFAVRFHAVLNRRTPQWKRVVMTTPIRWAPGDPLERFISDALLLDAAAAPAELVAGAERDSVCIEQVERNALVEDESTLRELFGLLVLAHYRTRPFDLRVLLDAPNMRVFVMRREGHVVATLLVALEGGFDAAAAHAIWAGQSRPQGHMLPETLAAHVGLVDGAMKTGARVVRIAVHPAVQGRGLGTRLLAQVPALMDESVDYWGSSFGATEPLLRFWRRAGYQPVRVSVRRGATSGAHSVMVVRAVNAAGRTLLGRARSRLAAQLPMQLADPLSRLEAAIAAELLRGLPCGTLDLGAEDWGDVIAFAFAHRIFEAVPGPLWRVAAWALAHRDEVALTRNERDALTVKLLQKREWRACARALGSTGRGRVLALLRRAFRKVVYAAAPVEIQEAARRLVADAGH